VTSVFAGQALASAPASRDPMKLLVVIGLLIAAVLVLGLTVLHLRKRLFDKGREANPASLMDDLRAMVRSGAITQDEYQSIRQRLIGKLAARSGAGLSDDRPQPETPINRPPDPISPPRPRRSSPDGPPA
jgi:hypothetical protein